MSRPKLFEGVDAIVDAIVDEIGPRISLALPLGIGKANHIANALVDRALDGQVEHLEIFTALTLNPPAAASGLQQRLMGPIVERLYDDYVPLKYGQLRAKGELPDHIVVREFYYPPGSLIGNEHAQRNHKSVNYTHALREVLDADIDVLAQLVAPCADGDASRYDLGGNTDLSLDVFSEYLRRREEEGDAPLLVAQTNSRLPALGGGAEIDAETFDFVLDNRELDFEPFGLPRMAPDPAEFAIGIRASSLLRDGGTIQVGIGSMGMALCWAAGLRHTDNAAYRQLADDLEIDRRPGSTVHREGGLKPFEQGLYASTEMFVEGLLHLLQCGVIDRGVAADLETQQRLDDGDLAVEDLEQPVAIHAGFYLGSPSFYRALRELPESDRDRIAMTSVKFTNLLLGDEQLKRRQRRHARFCNEAMKVTLLGAVVSDGLENQRVVSGVGGQFEFVKMAHELDGARSIIMLPATRESGGTVESNVVWRYGHTTIPRHLRDIIVTEYGVADLRGKSDEEVVRALIRVADSRFQGELVEQAIEADKLPDDYEIPVPARDNTPEALDALLREARASGRIPRTPFGSDLTDIELDLVAGLQALGEIRDELRQGKLPDVDLDDVLTSLSDIDDFDEHLGRMGLAEADNAREQALRRVIVYGLAASEVV
ncbi:MAG: acetyl-CoA hydrolase/transferase C-terminal domain-containing protein [Myxococcota bacterium]